jgi:seryl-tRNA synthetase
MARTFQLNKVYNLLKTKWKLHHCLIILVFIGIVVYFLNSIQNSFKLIKKLESENEFIENEINQKEQMNKDYVNKIIPLDMKLKTKKDQLEQLLEEGKKLEKEGATSIIFDKENDEYNKLLNEYEALKNKFHDVIELNNFYKEKYQRLENELKEIDTEFTTLSIEYSEL